MSWNTRALFGVLLLAASAQCFAVDGVCLISQNQATGAVSSPCTGDTRFPIIISHPGSYRLSSNLAVSTTKNAIEVASDNVTIDLNGFTVGCAAAGACGFGLSFEGIAAEGHNQFAVKNGAVSGFDFGIDVLGGTVDGVFVSGCGAVGISVALGAVRNSTVVNGGSGSIGIRFSVGGIISANVVANNNGTGIIASNASVIGNVAINNGMDFQCNGDVVYGSNVFSSTPSIGAAGCVSQNNNICTAAGC